MKIVSISWSDHQGAGGTGITSYELHMALKRAGVDSKIFCSNQTTNSPDSFRIKRWRPLEGVLRRIASPLGFNDLHGISAFGIAREKVFREADLVHFHSLHSGYFNIFALPYLTRRKPAVWTMHDVWPITGHCAANLDCERWVTGCGRCPYPQTYPPIRRDATHAEWLLKRRAYRRSRFTAVVASRWYASLLKRSMLSDKPVEVIPWGVPLDIYRPLDRALSRNTLNIPHDKKVILFSARRIGDPGKGADLLEKAFERMPGSMKKDLMLVTLGGDPGSHFRSTGFPVLDLGWVGSHPLKAIAYSAADVFVAPTSQETFGMMFIESMACGTPVVSFDLGPIPEIVRPGETGLLGRPLDVDGLSRNIMQILGDEPLRQRMSKRCREVAEEYYSFDLQVERYLSLYRRVISQ